MKAKNKPMAELYFRDDFEAVCEKFYKVLKEKDYYHKNLFVHELSSAIRAKGNPETTVAEYKDSTNSDYVCDIVILINKLLKGYHLNNPEKPRRFVIDSIRNSFEIAYLRERYHSFYMIALHNDGKEEVAIREKLQASGIEDENKRKQMATMMMELNRGENKTDDFEHGKFYSPDIARCVSESEIHIAYKRLEELENEEKKVDDIYTNSFYSYTEQWMKFAALIIRPGLITPTRDERCMSMAYVAKYNSGCISRQVGCVIVDKENAVQSVGWNDPPANQIPCNLRYAEELLEKKEQHSGHDIHTASNQHTINSKATKTTSTQGRCTQKRTQCSG